MLKTLVMAIEQDLEHGELSTLWKVTEMITLEQNHRESSSLWLAEV